MEENGKKYLGFQGTEQKVETDLESKTAEKLFGKQSPNGHQIIGNCWLISQMKQIETDPKLKLFIYNLFDAELDKYGQLESVTITLRDGKKLKNGSNKIKFDKDIVEEVSKIGAAEHLSPAMSCLALLSAIYRKQEVFHIGSDHYKHKTSEIPEQINKEYLKELFKLNDTDNPIHYALRVSNEAGQGYRDFLSLFCSNNKKTSITTTERQVLAVPRHAIASYGNVHLNPQNSYSLFHFANTKVPNIPFEDIPKNEIYRHLDYYFPNMKAK